MLSCSRTVGTEEAVRGWPSPGPALAAQPPSLMEGAHPSQQGPGAPHGGGAAGQSPRGEPWVPGGHPRGPRCPLSPFVCPRETQAPLSPRPGRRGSQARWGHRVEARWTGPWKGAAHRTVTRAVGPGCPPLGASEGSPARDHFQKLRPWVWVPGAPPACVSLSLEQRPARGRRLAWDERARGQPRKCSRHKTPPPLPCQVCLLRALLGALLPPERPRTRRRGARLPEGPAASGAGLGTPRARGSLGLSPQGGREAPASRPYFRPASRPPSSSRCNPPGGPASSVFTPGSPVRPQRSRTRAQAWHRGRAPARAVGASGRPLQGPAPLACCPPVSCSVPLLKGPASSLLPSALSTPVATCSRSEVFPGPGPPPAAWAQSPLPGTSRRPPGAQS